MKYLLILLLLLAGCNQRIYQHDIVDPNGISHTYWYKSNSFASDSSAEYVEIITPDGTIIRIWKPLQDNDSVKVITPWGIGETFDAPVMRTN